MSINVVRIEGGHAPVLFCDVCNLRIEAAQEGLARWNPIGPEDGVEYVHKGACDRRSDPRRERFWQDLDVHLVYLRDNLRLSGRAWREAERVARSIEAG